MNENEMIKRRLSSTIAKVASLIERYVQKAEDNNGIFGGIKTETYLQMIEHIKNAEAKVNNG